MRHPVSVAEEDQEEREGCLMMASRVASWASNRRVAQHQVLLVQDTLVARKVLVMFDKGEHSTHVSIRCTEQAEKLTKVAWFSVAVAAASTPPLAAISFFLARNSSSRFLSSLADSTLSFFRGLFIA